MYCLFVFVVFFLLAVAPSKLKSYWCWLLVAIGFRFVFCSVICVRRFSSDNHPGAIACSVLEKTNAIQMCSNHCSTIDNTATQMLTEPFSAFINHLFASGINSNGSACVREQINFPFLPFPAKSLQTSHCQVSPAAARRRVD